MNLQELIATVDEYIGELVEIEMQAESKLNVLEEIKTRAVDTRENLEHDKGVLDSLEESFEEVLSITADADSEGIG